MILVTMGIKQNDLFWGGDVGTDESYTDAELARVSVLILRCHENSVRVTCGKRLASVMKNFNKKIDRKNINFRNKIAI